MSMEYRPILAIPFRDIDKRLEKYGIKVDMSGHETALTGPNGTLVATPEGGSTHFERNLRADTEAVLNAIQTEYGIEIVDEDDPRFWGYASWDEMKNQTNREIVKLAFLMNQGSLSPADDEIFTAGLARLDSQGFRALSLAAKLLEGKRYRVTTDNPRTIDRCKSLAEYMGAVVGLEEGEWWTSILICPSTHPLDHSQNEHQ